MKWPNDYLIPGVQPFYQEENGIIYCADCKNVLPHLPKIDLCLTDPPYGINIAPSGIIMDTHHDKAPPQQYTPSYWDKNRPTKLYFDQMIKVSKTLIIFGGNYFADILPASKCWLCWDKGTPRGFSRAQIELCWTNSSSYSRIYYVLWNGFMRDRSGENLIRYHPTQKPVNLMKVIITDFSNNNDIILDPFLGSGTTIIAAKEVGRRFIGIEAEEEYCEIAAKRLEKIMPPLFIENNTPKPKKEKMQGSLF